MIDNQVGAVEVITFRTNRRDEIYKYPLEGVFIGTSVSHVALRLTFNDKQLFDKYIAGNKRIPYVENLPSTLAGEKIYSVYFSFWPQTNSYMQPDKSYLATYKHDCEQSALGSPMTYNSVLGQEVGQDRSLTSSLLPVLKYFFKSEIDLPPSIILHITRLQGILNSTLSKVDALQREGMVTGMVGDAQNYALKYEEWCDALLAEHNITEISHSKAQLLEKSTAVQIANAKLLACSNILRNDVVQFFHSGQEITDPQFYSAMDQFLTFGRPETDIETLPIIRSADNGTGLELEPMLRYIKDVADHSEKYNYDLFKLSCATMSRNILQQGVAFNAKRQIRNLFDAPWYVRWFNAPVSPAMVIRLAADAQQLLGGEQQFQPPGTHCSVMTDLQFQRRRRNQYTFPECNNILSIFDKMSCDKKQTSNMVKLHEAKVLKLKD